MKFYKEVKLWCYMANWILTSYYSILKKILMFESSFLKGYQTFGNFFFVVEFLISQKFLAENFFRTWCLKTQINFD